MDFTGQTIGQYRVEEKLDKDNPGMSEVYRGYNPVLDRQVVIKILSTSLARDPTFVQRFQQEARALARLKHPHIVSVYDAGHYAQFDYLVMEYIPGGSLAGVINSEGPLPLPRVVMIIKQIASALDYAHEPPRSMVHRDIKPANILLDADGSAKLTDFGLVKVSEVSLTMVGQRFGTPAYMSPEQVLPVSGVGPWTDIYALGIVAYQMLTKRLPFRGNVQEILDAQLKQPPPSMRSFRPEIPEAVDRVVAKALSKAPGERYATAGAFAAALEDAARQRPPLAQEPTLPPAANPYATRLVEAVRRPEEEHDINRAARPFASEPVTAPTPVASFQPGQQPVHHRPLQADMPTEIQPAVGAGADYVAVPRPPLPPVQPLPAAYHVQESAVPRRSSRLILVLAGLAALFLLLALLVLAGFVYVRRNVASDGDPTSAATSGAAVVVRPTSRATRTPALTLTPALTATPNVTPTPIAIGVTAINATSVFTADLPIRFTVAGSNLTAITNAELVAPNRASIPLRVEQAGDTQTTLVLETVPEPLGGLTSYQLVLNGTPQGGSSITLQDFSERKTAQGILADYSYTNRITSDNAGAYTQLHKLPDVTSEEVATLRNNDQVDVLRTEGEWYLLRISGTNGQAQNGQVGWLERWLVDNQNVPPPPPTATPVPAPTRVPAITFGVRVDVNYEGSGNSGQFTSCISGKVLGPGGRPYAGATINVNNGPNNSFTTRTGGDGIYHVCNLGASHWSVVLQRVPGQTLSRQAVGRVYVNGGAQDAIVNFSQR